MASRPRPVPPSPARHTCQLEPGCDRTATVHVITRDGVTTGCARHTHRATERKRDRLRLLVYPTDPVLDGPHRDPFEELIRAELVAAGHPEPVAVGYAVAVELLNGDGAASTHNIGRYGRCARASAELLSLVAGWMARRAAGGAA